MPKFPALLEEDDKRAIHRGSNYPPKKPVVSGRGASWALVKRSPG